jgi:excinuclease ABC subunit C
MKNDRAVSNIADLAGNRYPHLKITTGRFPRLLATRLIDDDGDEYFGAFLTKTALRILIDLLNRTFRLRSCELALDGNFEMPCTQYYRRRCVAPCVGQLCSEDEYSRLVELVRLFLRNDRGAFRTVIHLIIEERSEDLDFEGAAKFRNILLAVENYWRKERIQVWLDDTVDTYAVEDTAEGTSVFLVSHRGRRVLGRKVFTIEREDYETSDEALAQIIDSFYLVHLPREIRVSRNFHSRKDLEEKLTQRFGRQARITVVNPQAKGINAYRGLLLSHDEHELDRAKPLASPEIISAKLRRIFDLEGRPTRIEAFDVAHISGTGFVAASAVWEKGHFVTQLYRFHVSASKTELGTLADAVMFRLADPSQGQPDLVVLDGGKPQLNAVLRQLKSTDWAPVPIIAAVKPPGKHSSIAAFLTVNGGSIPFDIDSPAHSMLQLLRDEAHNLANRIHRDYREMKPFYEAAGHPEPLIVPIRLHAENGGAEDLIPISTR